jgi:hypothetical protein
VQEREKDVKKSHCGIDYNTNMKGVDQLVNMHLIEKKRVSRYSNDF